MEFSNVDITASIAFHRAHGKLATVTGVYPPRRFGALDIVVTAASDSMKSSRARAALSAGVVLSPKVGLYLENDEMVWEQAPMRRLAAKCELCAFHHKGFFQPMDTQRDHTCLEQVWASGYAPWRCW